MRGVHPDVVTDQTSAHDPANGYRPQGWSLDRWFTERERDPAAVAAAAKASLAVQVRAQHAVHHARVPTLDYGNTIRQIAQDERVAYALHFAGFVPANIRTPFCPGVCPFP